MKKIADDNQTIFTGSKGNKRPSYVQTKTAYNAFIERHTEEFVCSKDLCNEIFVLMANTARCKQTIYACKQCRCLFQGRQCDSKHRKNNKCTLLESFGGETPMDENSRMQQLENFFKNVGESLSTTKTFTLLPLSSKICCEEKVETKDTTRHVNRPIGFKQQKLEKEVSNLKKRLIEQEEENQNLKNRKKSHKKIIRRQNNTLARTSSRQNSKSKKSGQHNKDLLAQNEENWIKKGTEQKQKIKELEERNDRFQTEPEKKLRAVVDSHELLLEESAEVIKILLPKIENQEVYANCKKQIKKIWKTTVDRMRTIESLNLNSSNAYHNELHKDIHIGFTTIVHFKY